MRIPRGIELALFAYWAFAVLQKYYGTVPVDWKSLAGAAAPHLPVAQFAWGNVLERLARLGAGHGAVLAWGAGVFGLGLAVAQALRLPSPRGGERAALAFGLGLAAAMLLFFALGLAGLWFPAFGWILAAVGAGAAWRARRDMSGWTGPGGPGRWLGLALTAVIGLNAAAIPAAWWLARCAERPVLGNWGAGGWAALVAAAWTMWAARALCRDGRGSAGPLPAWERAILAAFAAELALVFLLVAAVVETPERFYDAQVYHLAGPALFAMHHKIIGLPNLLHSAFPLGVQMLYGWQWLLAGEPVTRAWRVWLVALVAWTVFRLAARVSRTESALVAAAVFAAFPLFTLNAVQTSVDIELTLIVLLASLAALEAGGRFRGIVPAAVLAGAAFGAKYTAVFFLPWLALLACVVPQPGRAPGRLRRMVPRIAVFAAVSLCWALPWFLRNEAVVGNPVYPYATRVFRAGRQWDAPRLVRFREQAAAYVIERKADLFRLPWRLSRGDTSENYIGIGFLLLLPVALAHPAAPGGIRVLGALGGLAVASWIGVTHIHRFVLAGWALLALFLSVSLWDFAGPRRWYARLCLVLLAVTGVTNLVAGVVLSRMVFDPVELLAGRESAAGYLGRKMINSYGDAAFGSRPLLRPGDRVMLAGESRGLYWSVPFYNHSAYDVQAFEEALRDSADAGSMARRLRQLGVSHIFVNDRETSRMKFRFQYPMLVLTPRDRGLLAGLWGHWVVPELDAASAHLYRVLRAPRPRTGTPEPLSFDENALRGEFEGFTTISWQGDAVIQMTKKMAGP